MIKRMTIMLLASAAVFGGLYGFQTFKAGIIKKVIAEISNPPETVSTTVVSSTSWQDQIEAIGTLKAANGADLALQTSGLIEKISFKSGDSVKEGQVLLRLSSGEDLAKLEALKATADNAEITLNRDLEQQKIKAVSQATVDTDQANLKNARALVDQQQAVVDQKILKAPFDGRLGISSIDLGQYITAGTTIVTLQSLDLLYVDMYLPQKQLSELKTGQGISLTVDAYPKRVFKGTISAINAKVDDTSRNVLVRASLKNEDGLLLPGMFGHVNIDTGTARDVVTLPQTALMSNPYGDIAFIIDKTADANGRKTVHQTFVRSGNTRGDNVSIVDGVKPGDEVVIAGQIKLHNGSVVVVDNTHIPVAQDAPVVTDQ